MAKTRTTPSEPLTKETLDKIAIAEVRRNQILRLVLALAAVGSFVVNLFGGLSREDLWGLFAALVLGALFLRPRAISARQRAFLTWSAAIMLVGVVVIVAVRTFAPSAPKCPTIPPRAFVVSSIPYDQRGSVVRCNLIVHRSEDSSTYKVPCGITGERAAALSLDQLPIRDFSVEFQTLVNDGKTVTVSEMWRFEKTSLDALWKAPNSMLKRELGDRPLDDDDAIYDMKLTVGTDEKGYLARLDGRLVIDRAKRTLTNWIPLSAPCTIYATRSTGELYDEVRTCR